MGECDTAVTCAYEAAVGFQSWSADDMVNAQPVIMDSQ